MEDKKNSLEKSSKSVNSSKRIKQVVTSVVFIAILAIGFIVSVAKKDTGFSETENRVLTQKPEFSVKNVIDGKFTKGYQDYVKDQFPLRNTFVTIRNVVEKSMLKTEINDVLICDDDYYIESHKRGNYESEEAISNAKKLGSFVATYEEQLGKQHVAVIIAPTAQTVLTNKMNDFMYAYNQNEYLDILRKNVGEDSFIKAYDILKEHNDEYIYYRTDHHWTTYGAFLVYKEWATKMGIEPLKDFDIEKKEVTSEFLGTINNKLNLSMKKDTITAYNIKNSDMVVNYNFTQDDSKGLFFDEYLNKKDKYSYFFGGNPGIVTIKNKNSNRSNEASDAENAESKTDNDDDDDDEKEKKSLLIIKDSYANCISNVYAANFDETYVVDMRYFNMSISEFVKEYKVTDILVLYNVDSFATDTKIRRIVR